MHLGLNAEPTALSATIAAFPDMVSARVFAPPGAGIPAWTHPTVTLLTRAGVIPWISFKDWVGESAIRGWLDAMPATVTACWATYHHEPEGDLLSGEFRQHWREFHQIVRAHRNSSKIKLVPIHTLYPARHKVGDRWNTDWTKWTGVFQQWAPLDTKGRYVGDWMGWDCYLETTASVYEDPRSFFRIPVAAAAYYGVPLAIPELGALRISTDPYGTGRAAWITGCLGYLRAQGATAVNWWHATGSKGHNYRLTDKPSATAWRNAMTVH